MRVAEDTTKAEGSKRVGIWIRVSTQDQAEGDSPEHHEKRARFYAEARGWQVVTVYHLEAVSGKSVMGLAETERMLEDIHSGRITGLIFSKLARLARNTKELLDFADTFRDCGADLISLAEAIDTSSPAGRMFFTVQAALTQFEREEIADRVAASVPVRARLGKPLGGAAPFGYRWRDRALVIDPAEAPVRQLMYELFLKHRRKKTVARLLNEAGYRTRSGARFSDTTVDRLLRDPVAKGMRRANYTRSLGAKKHWMLKPEDQWVFTDAPAVISEELWRQCNQLLEAQKQQPRFSAKKPVQLFAGLAFCHCGAKLYVPSNTPKYVCFTCRNKIPVKDLEAVYHEQMKNFFLSPEEVMRYVAKADEALRGKQALLESLTAKQARLRRDMDRLMRLYLDEQISAEGFGAQYKPLEEQAQKVGEQVPIVRTEIEHLKAQLFSPDGVAETGRRVYLSWGEMAREEKRRIVENTVEKIVVGEREITIELDYLPPASAQVANGQHNDTPALPFCHLTLNAERPKPAAYPAELTTFGDHIRTRRVDAGLFQREAAEVIGVDETSVFNWESNRVQPAVRLIPRIIEFLGYCPYTPGLPISEWLRLIRQGVGFSQERMAEALGVDESTWRRWEAGRRRPAPEYLDSDKIILRTAQGVAENTRALTHSLGEPAEKMGL